MNTLSLFCNDQPSSCVNQALLFNDDYYQHPMFCYEAPKETITAEIKSARKEDCWYTDQVPPTLCSAPYKYDFKLNQVPLTTKKPILLRLINKDTKNQVHTNYKGQIAFQWKLRNVIHKDESCDFEFRICFATCSFHHNKSAFYIQCVDSDSKQVLFTSKDFYLVARKKS